MTSITNSTFYGVKWDATAIESINNVSQALLNLTELYRSQNIQIDALVKVEQAKLIDDEKNENQEPGKGTEQDADDEVNELMSNIISDMQKVLSKIKPK